MKAHSTPPYLLWCILLFIGNFIFGLQALSAPSVGIAPAPTWIIPVVPEGKAPSPKEFSEGYFVRFSDMQVNLATKTAYSRSIRQIALESGIQNGSEISIAFDPSYERLLFHHVTILRNGKTISHLNASDFRVMPLESDRQRFIYNGYYSATLILKDVRKGDQIDFGYSRVGWNPVFQDKYTSTFSFGVYDYIPHIHYALFVPEGRQLQFKDFNKPPRRTSKKIGGTTVHEWNMHNVKSRPIEDYSPSWLNIVPSVQISEYKNWQEVVAWGLGFYQNQEASGALKAKVEEWKKTANGSRNAYLEQAVRFVQDEIRYLGIETGENSHRPHSPEQVFNQRYGDCKDKTLLLCTLLKANGIEADPVLVDTYKTSHLADYLPAPTNFNHVVSRVKLNDPASTFKGESSYAFIDATLSMQGGTASRFYFPAYGQGLLLKQGQNGLIPVTAQNSGHTTVNEEIVLPPRTDSASQGFLTVKTIYFEGEADNIRGQFQQSNLSEMEDGYLNYYRDTYGHAAFEMQDTVEYYDQREAGNFSLIERYTVTKLWDYDSDRQKFSFTILGRILYDQLINLPNRPRKYPVALRYPYHLLYTIQVRMPSSWNVPTDEWTIEREAYKILFKSRFIPEENMWELFYDYETLADHVSLAQIGQFRDDMKKLVGNLEYELTYPDSSLVASSDLNGWMIGLFLLALSLGVWLSFRIYRYSLDRVTQTGTGCPIAGWLVLLGIGLVVKPLSLLASMIGPNTMVYFTNSGWEAMAGQSSGKIALYHAMLPVEVVCNIFLLCGSLLLIVLFFKKRYTFPVIFSVYTGGYLLFLVADTFLSRYILVTQSTNESYEDMVDLVRVFIYSAVWIAYVNRSQRVQETFVNPYQRQSVLESDNESEMIPALD